MVSITLQVIGTSEVCVCVRERESSGVKNHALKQPDDATWTETRNDATWSETRNDATWTQAQVLCAFAAMDTNPAKRRRGPATGDTPGSSTTPEAPATPVMAMFQRFRERMDALVRLGPATPSRAPRTTTKALRKRWTRGHGTAERPT